MKKVIRLNRIKTPEDFIKAFNQLKEAAQKNGVTCQLRVDTSESLALYHHDDYPGVVLVDKAESSWLYKCPKCGGYLSPSHVTGYAFACENCCEDFYRFEVDTVNVAEN